MDLPGRLNDLIAAVAKANPKTVVVMQSGTPVEMPWLDNVNALVHAWYGGNETGNAIADILFGDVNPSGKLPLSFPIIVQDNPAYLNYRNERGRTLYGEDIYVGYRYYEALRKQVLFPFGHGLSYTTFNMSALKVSNDGENVKINLCVENTGKIKGQEVVQLYVTQQSPSINRPKKELKGFTKVELESGQHKALELNILTKYATSFWDEGKDMWISEKDTYRVIVANSSETELATVLEESFEVKSTSWWKGL